MMRRTFNVQCLIIIFFITKVLSKNNCTSLNYGWEKVDSVMPEDYQIINVLYSSTNSEGIVKICFDRCVQKNCTAFYIDISRNTCANIHVVESKHFLPSPNFIFYHTICIKAPENCRKNRLWQVQRTLGAILKDSNDLIWLPGILTRIQCYEKCLEAGINCKSAQFHTSDDLAIGDVKGNCSLLSIERATRPQSYQVFLYKYEYLENQCHILSSNDYCSYAEFYNETFPYSDLKITNINERECEKRCNDNGNGFICRGFTVNHPASQNSSICLLHSDDTISTGVSTLKTFANVVYKEREPCVNLKVDCKNDSLSVELITSEPFFGRLYTNGYSEKCNVQGIGSNSTVLKLEIPNKQKLHDGNINCGIVPVIAMGSDNETRIAVRVTIVVQFNPIIQRLGDQLIKVGCTLFDDQLPLPKNIIVESGFSYTDPNAGLPANVGTIFNTIESPVVIMKILNENMQEIESARLGQNLTLKIQLIPSDGPYDIMVTDLKASNSLANMKIFLLDSMGCPVNTKIFPAMEKNTVDKSLVAKFGAFKFPESFRVKFHGLVKFCLTECPPVKCRNEMLSYGRRRRSSNIQDNELSINNYSNHDVSNLNELPVEYSIFVQSDNVAADSLRSPKNPDAVLIAGEKSLEGLLCVDAALAFGILICWLIIQILLTITCIIIIRKYKKLAYKAEEDRADILTQHLYGMHNGNFEIARRVRWADHNSSIIT